MKRVIALTVYLLATGCPRLLADETGAVPDSPAAVPAADVVAARQALMAAIEMLMEPIDTYTVDDTVDAERVRTNAAAISAMLLTVAHLFPADTDLYSADDEFPATLALPAVWQSFATFYRLAASASAAAAQVADSADGDALRAAAADLRGACDACHGAYLLPYEAPSVTEEDLDFDFDSIFDDD